MTDCILFVSEAGAMLLDDESPVLPSETSLCSMMSFSFEADDRPELGLQDPPDTESVSPKTPSLPSVSSQQDPVDLPEDILEQDESDAASNFLADESMHLDFSVPGPADVRSWLERVAVDLADSQYPMGMELYSVPRVLPKTVNSLNQEMNRDRFFSRSTF